MDSGFFVQCIMKVGVIQIRLMYGTVRYHYYWAKQFPRLPPKSFMREKKDSELHITA